MASGSFSSHAMAGPTIDFWQARFETQQTGWDRGAPHPQLLNWLQGQSGPALAPGARVAVPGCGRGWEVVALAQAGFDVTGLDYTPAAVAEAQAKLQAAGIVASQARIEQADVLLHQPAQPYDAVHEQTCLCALHPDHWTRYAAQLHRWLRPGGTLHALFMQAPREGALQEGRIEGPPYHCDINAMRALFPDTLWVWPQPPYAAERHPQVGMHELVVPLIRR